MKATSFKPVSRMRCDTPKSDHCDNQCDKHCDTCRSKRVKCNLPQELIACHSAFSKMTGKTPTTVTRFVTVVVTVLGNYAERLRMSNKKIRSVWLTVGRVAELKGCSVRTAWRYIGKNNMLTHKEQIAIGSARVVKTFVMTDPALLTAEMEDCNLRGVVPAEFIERKFELGDKQMNSALIYGYSESDAVGGYNEAF